MRNLYLALMCLVGFSTMAIAQDPGTPGKSDILTEKSQIVQELKKETAKVKDVTGAQSTPVMKSKHSKGKKVPNSFVVMLKDDVVQPLAKTKSSASSRESQRAAAEKHEAAAEKAIRKYAIETLGLSNSEIQEIYTGAISGFSVKLSGKKSSSSWITKTKSAKSTLDVAQDEEFELADYTEGELVDAYSPAAWAPQYADYGNWVAGGCNCTGHSKWIWVIDTGIDLNHPDLNVRTGFYARSFVPGESPEDYRGHGTHVAGIAAAKHNSFGAKGIAYGATVVPLKVFPRSGGAPDSRIVAALNWVYKYGVRGDVVNLSLGRFINPIFGKTSLEACIEALAKKGIYVVISAGNDKIHARYKTPARVNGSKIYTIAATQKSPYWWTHQFASSYSNYGKNPVDFAAPGTSIYSTYKNGGYRYMSGTSMAAPNFAGALLCGTKRKKGYYYYRVNPTSHKLYVIRAK